MGQVKKIFGKVGKWIKKHKKLTIFLFIVVIAAVGYNIYAAKQKELYLASQSQQKETVVIGRQDIMSYISTTGTVESDENKDVKSTLTGLEVEQVLVEVGDFVNVGDPLVIFDTEDLEEDIQNVYTDISNAEQQNNLSLTQVERDYQDAQANAQDNNATAARNLTEAQDDLNEAHHDIAALEIQLASETQFLDTKKLELEEIRAEYDRIKMDYEQKQATYNDAQTSLQIANSNLSIARSELNDYLIERPEDIDPVTGQLADGASNTAERLKEDVDEEQENVYNYTVISENTSIELEKLSNDYAEVTTVFNTLEAAYQEAYSTWEVTNNALVAERNTLDSIETNYANLVASSQTTQRNGQSSIQGSADRIETQELSISTSMRTLNDQLDTYLENLEKTSVTTPIEGIITDVNIEKGDTYTGGVLVTVENTDTYIIATSIDEYDISSLREGMRVVIKTDATRDDELEGVITFLSPTPVKPETSDLASAASGSASSSALYRIEITINTQDERLRLGMNAKTNIILEEVSQVLAVPYNAIQTNADGDSYIILLETDAAGVETEREVVVSMGSEGDYYVEVICDEELEGKTVVIPPAEGDAMADMMRAITGE